MCTYLDMIGYKYITYLYTYLCYVCAYLYMSVYVCMHACMYMYVCERMYVYKSQIPNLSAALTPKHVFDCGVCSWLNFDSLLVEVSYCRFTISTKISSGSNFNPGYRWTQWLSLGYGYSSAAEDEIMDTFVSHIERPVRLSGCSAGLSSEAAVPNGRTARGGRLACPEDLGTCAGRHKDREVSS